MFTFPFKKSEIRNIINYNSLASKLPFYTSNFQSINLCFNIAY